MTRRDAEHGAEMAGAPGSSEMSVFIPTGVIDLLACFHKNQEERGFVPRTHSHINSRSGGP